MIFIGCIRLVKAWIFVLNSILIANLSHFIQIEQLLLTVLSVNLRILFLYFLTLLEVTHDSKVIFLADCVIIFKVSSSRWTSLLLRFYWRIHLDIVWSIALSSIYYMSLVSCTAVFISKWAFELILFVIYVLIRFTAILILIMHNFCKNYYYKIDAMADI